MPKDDHLSGLSPDTNGQPTSRPSTPHAEWFSPPADYRKGDIVIGPDGQRWRCIGRSKPARKR